MEREIGIGTHWDLVYADSLHRYKEAVWYGRGTAQHIVAGSVALAYFLVAKCALLHIHAAFLFVSPHCLLFWNGEEQTGLFHPLLHFSLSWFLREIVFGIYLSRPHNILHCFVGP